MRNCSDPYNTAVLQCTIDLLPTSQIVPCLSLAIARIAVLENGDVSGAGTGTGGGGVAAGRGVGGDGQCRGGQGKRRDGGVDRAIADVGTGTNEGPGSHEDGGHEDLHELHFDCVGSAAL